MLSNSLALHVDCDSSNANMPQASINLCQTGMATVYLHINLQLEHWKGPYVILQMPELAAVEDNEEEDNLHSQCIKSQINDGRDKSQHLASFGTLNRRNSKVKILESGNLSLSIKL